MRGAAGACSRASTASTTIRWRAGTSAGGRNGISPRLSSACARPATCAGRWRERSARRATTPSGSKARPIPWREAEVSELAVWTRLDRPGRDAALLKAHAGGWLLRGAAAFEHELVPAVGAHEGQGDPRL